MTISTIALDLHQHQQQPQPRTEPASTRPRRSPRLKRTDGVSSIRSPRLLLDVDLTVKSTATSATARLHHKENVEVELGTVSHTKEQVVLTEMEELVSTSTVSKLSRPAWPRSNPTIPSTLYKNDFQTKVKQVVVVFIKAECCHYHH